MSNETKQPDERAAMAEDLRAEQTFLGPYREATGTGGPARWDRLQRVIDYLESDTEPQATVKGDEPEHPSIALAMVEPCPFCGSANVDPYGWAGNDGRTGPACDDCGATAETIAGWNQRAAAQPDGRAAIPLAWQDTFDGLLAYVLQEDLHNRLTPRVIDIAYTAFMSGAAGKNKDDGGPCDWFNDTKPAVQAAIEKLRKDLSEARAAAPKATVQGDERADAFLESMKPRANKVQDGVRLWAGWALVAAFNAGTRAAELSRAKPDTLSVDYTFMFSEEESLNELTPIEMLHGSPLAGRTEVEACQQRMLDMSTQDRYRRVALVRRQHELDNAA